MRWNFFSVLVKKQLRRRGWTGTFAGAMRSMEVWSVNQSWLAEPRNRTDRLFRHRAGDGDEGGGEMSEALRISPRGVTKRLEWSISGGLRRSGHYDAVDPASERPCDEGCQTWRRRMRRRETGSRASGIREADVPGTGVRERNTVRRSPWNGSGNGARPVITARDCCWSGERRMAAPVAARDDRPSATVPSSCGTDR